MHAALSLRRCVCEASSGQMLLSPSLTGCVALLLTPVYALRSHARADAVYALHQSASAAEFQIVFSALRSERAMKTVLALRNAHVTALDALAHVLCSMPAARRAAKATDSLVAWFGGGGGQTRVGGFGIGYGPGSYGTGGFGLPGGHGGSGFPPQVRNIHARWRPSQHSRLRHTVGDG
ncbi:hypothetical protein T492DRAFT_354012 [Pavlovales sp. CCMP2436]|nr:hypothetical protein T492DRAFT_354012 [Pavlovales sp. CCMP2436]